MTITSVSYLAFLGVSLLIYWQLPHKYQWLVLLADNLIFFFLNSTAYTFLYLLLCVVSLYFAALYFKRNVAMAKKRAVLIAAIVLNIGMLAALKYTNLLIQTVNFFAVRSGDAPLRTVNWLSPIAISYYTLQAVAYLLDCYWEITEPEKNLGKLFVFVSYFPLMVSGPICRHKELGRQLFEEHRFDYDRVTRGCRRIAWGIAKKVVVADRIAVIVNYIFGSPDYFNGVWIWLSAFAYVAQLYFDFSGCMDIVIGASSCFGITLQENFHAPFLSRSIQEFWRRWHITLGLWHKDYVMYPLLKSKAFGDFAKRCKRRFGKRGKQIPSYIAMLVVWTLNGLWHGSSWKYVVAVGWWFWLAATLGQILKPQFEELKRQLNIDNESLGWKGLQIVRTFLIFSFGMIFFRAASIPDALDMIARGFDFSKFRLGFRHLLAGASIDFGGKIPLASVIIIAALQVFCDLQVCRGKDMQGIITKQKTAIRWTLYFLFLFMIALGGAFGKSQFIYFGF